jgi:hypothetical protein
MMRAALSTGGSLAAPNPASLLALRTPHPVIHNRRAFASSAPANARHYWSSMDTNLITLYFFVAQILSATPKRIAGM